MPDSMPKLSSTAEDVAMEGDPKRSPADHPDFRRLPFREQERLLEAHRGMCEYNRMQDRNRYWEREEAITPPPADWLDPPRPSGRSCACGAEISPAYVRPVFLHHRLEEGTGKWRFPSCCAGCKAAETRRLKGEALIADLKLDEVHLPMELETWERVNDPKWHSLIAGFAAGSHGLFIHGPSGTGKTHLAVAALKARIRTSAMRGAFRVVPSLAAELRRMSRDGEDWELLEDLGTVDTLVLDDLGAERRTDYVVDSLSSIIDRRDRDRRKRLIVTSNFTLDELRQRFGSDRITSRLAGLCKVAKLDGRDHRMANIAGR